MKSIFDIRPEEAAVARRARIEKALDFFGCLALAPLAAFILIALACC